MQSGRALSAEVKRLAFYGPGPKMAGYVAVSDPVSGHTQAHRFSFLPVPLNAVIKLFS